MQVKPEDIKGDIEGFPIHIVQAMVDEQIRQGNKGDVGVFQDISATGKQNGGFYWSDSKEGEDFWHYVIVLRHFNLFPPPTEQPTLTPAVVQQIINAIRATTDTLNLSQTDRHKVISDLNEWERVKRDLK